MGLVSGPVFWRYSVLEPSVGVVFGVPSDVFWGVWADSRGTPAVAPTIEFSRSFVLLWLWPKTVVNKLHLVK